MRSTIVAVVLIFVVLGLLLGLADSFDIAGSNKTSLAASSIEDALSGYVEAMQTTSELPQMQNVSHVHSISTSQMGIPEDLDPEKREIAKGLLAEHPEFESIFFLTPKGDVYLGEPFAQQKQLPKLNYADRDWYKGVDSTHAPYISSVFMSAAIHEPAVAVAVPVFKESEIVGYWVAIVDLGDIKSRLSEFSGQSRMLLVDQNGLEIADTGRTGELSELRSFSSLQSVQSAIAGREGTVVETLDNITTNTQFAPVDANPNTWAILLFNPVE